MSEIAGQHVLITGGASGIGRLMAKKLAALGCRISVWDIHRQNLDTVVAELNAAAGGSAQGFLCDVSKRAVVYRAAEETRAAAGAVDILINNAGVVSGAFRPRRVACGYARTEIKILQSWFPTTPIQAR